MANELEMVRVAASKRRFLLSWLVAVAYLVLATAYQMVVGTAFVEVPGVVVLAVALGVWWFNRTKAVWVERDAGGITIRTRRWCKWEDLSSGRLRSDGTITDEFSPDVAVAFNPDSISWWRSDRTLTVGPHRFSIYPESRALAEALADPSRWTQANAQARTTNTG